MKVVILIFMFIPYVLFADTGLSSNIDNLLNGYLGENESYEVMFLIEQNRSETTSVTYIQWMKAGLTYWENHLTIAVEINDTLHSFASKELNGSIDTMSLENEIIEISGKTLGPKDPLCCPTQIEKRYYALKSDEIIKLG